MCVVCVCECVCVCICLSLISLSHSEILSLVTPAYLQSRFPTTVAGGGNQRMQGYFYITRQIRLLFCIV